MDELYDTNEPAVNTNGGSVGNWNMACFQMYYGRNIDIDVNKRISGENRGSILAENTRKPSTEYIEKLDKYLVVQQYWENVDAFIYNADPTGCCFSKAVDYYVN